MLFHTSYFIYSIIYAETWTILHKNTTSSLGWFINLKQFILVDLYNFYKHCCTTYILVIGG